MHTPNLTNPYNHRHFVAFTQSTRVYYLLLATLCSFFPAVAFLFHFIVFVQSSRPRYRRNRLCCSTIVVNVGLLLFILILSYIFCRLFCFFNVVFFFLPLSVAVVFTQCYFNFLYTLFVVGGKEVKGRKQQANNRAREHIIASGYD